MENMTLLSTGFQNFALMFAKSLGIPYYNLPNYYFPDREIKIEIPPGAKYAQEIFLVHPLYPNVHTQLIRLLLLADNLKAMNISKLYVFSPYLPYSRQNKPYNDNQFTGFQTISSLIKNSSVDKLFSLDIHNYNNSNNKIVNVNLSQFYANHISHNKALGPKIAIVAPDKGASRNATNIAQKLKLPLILLQKERKNDKVTITNITGSPSGLDCVIIDDIACSNSTLSCANEYLRKHGAKTVSAYVTHQLNETYSELDYYMPLSEIFNNVSSNTDLVCKLCKYIIEQGPINAAIQS